MHNNRLLAWFECNFIVFVNQALSEALFACYFLAETKYWMDDSGIL